MATNAHSMQCIMDNTVSLNVTKESSLKIDEGRFFHYVIVLEKKVETLRSRSLERNEAFRWVCLVFR